MPLDIPGSYGIFDKRFWSRDAREADAIGLLDKELSTKQKYNTEAEDKAAARVKDRDTRLHSFAKEMLGEETASKLQSILNQIDAEESVQRRRDDRVGNSARGRMAEMEAEIAQSGQPARIAATPGITEDEMAARRNKTSAERIASGMELARTPSLVSGELNARQAGLKAKLAGSMYDAENPGIKDQLEAARLVTGSNTAQRVAEIGANSRETVAERNERARSGGGALPIPPEAKTKRGFDMKALRGRVATAAPVESPDVGIDADSAQRAVNFLGEILKRNNPTPIQ